MALSTNKKTKIGFSKTILTTIVMWLMLLILSFFISNGSFIISEIAAELDFIISAIAFIALVEIYRGQKNYSQDSKKLILWLCATNIWSI